MKVLIADKFPAKYIDDLKQLCSSVEFAPDTSAEDLPSRISNANVLIVRSTEVRTEAITKATDLNLIIRAGAGYNTIDVAAASEKGIYVANCPGKNSVAVAELVMGLIISLDRRIPDNAGEERIRHTPYRRLDDTGPGGNRRRGPAHCPFVRRDGRRTQLRQPGKENARQMAAQRASL